MAFRTSIIFLIFVVERFVVTYCLEEPSCGLCPRFEYEKKMLEEMVRIEHKLELSQESHENQKKRINILESKLNDINDILLKPKVGFHATDVTNQSPTTGETLLFAKVKVNTGGRFDVHTGVFTAPVDGMYMFATQICNHGDRGLQFHMYVNAVMMTNTYHFDQHYVCTSANMVADLKAGDRVCVQANHTTYKGQVIYQNIHRECMFTGVLVS